MTVPFVWLFATLSGLLLALSLAPYDQWYLAYLAYVPLFVKTRSLLPIKQGLAFSLAGAVIATNWWYSAIVFSAYYFVLIVALLCFAFFVWGYLSSTFRSDKANPFATLLMPAVIWVGIEYLLNEWVGIPCNIGISQANQPLLIQSAAYFGVYATSFLIVISNTMLAMIVTALRRKQSFKKHPLAAISLTVMLLALNVTLGALKLSQPQSVDATIKVAVIQPVITSDQYTNGWRNLETRRSIKEALNELTRRALARSPDMIVWPEGGNGYFNMRISELRNQLYETAARHKTALLISSDDLNEQGEKFNSIFSISKQGVLLGRYDKVDLVPWAEDSFTAGTDFSPLPSEYGEIGAVICYESNYPSPLRTLTAKGAELLFISTSDAAFKKTALTLNHTRMAIFRAVENNRWVIHASNAGPSVIVSPRGMVTASSGFYQRDILMGDVGFVRDVSIFTRIGYLLPAGFSVFVLLLLLLRLYRFGKNKIQPNTVVVEQRVRHGYGVLVIRLLPAGVLYLAFLAGIISASLTMTYRQAEQTKSLKYAFEEFLTPPDELLPDTLTDKFLQAQSNTCGPAVMAYVLSYFGKELLEEDIVGQVNMTERGTSMLELKKVAIKNGFTSAGVKENYAALRDEPLPVIAYINDSHYVAVIKVTADHLYLYDPAIGHVKVARVVFEQAWNGYLLLIRMQAISDVIG